MTINDKCFNSLPPSNNDLCNHCITAQTKSLSFYLNFPAVPGSGVLAEGARENNNLLWDLSGEKFAKSLFAPSGIIIFFLIIIHD